MSRVLEQLVTLLALERIEENLFRGQAQDLGWGQVFGGHVVGQALSAAVQTVPPERHVHSLHGYFLRPGDVRRPIVYTVDRVRDGKSFTTRHISAIQSGQPIFEMSASFQPDEPGFDHADPMPAHVPGPEGLPNESELWRSRLAALPEALQSRIQPLMRARALADRPIELRPVDPVDPFEPGRRPPEQAVWVRAAGTLPDTPALHRYLLAYCSDFALIATALRPHAATWFDPAMQVASLDHAMWFHRPFRMDDWLLHVMRSPSASGSRGLAQGAIYSRDGVLVATTAQEGLTRQR